MEIEICQCCGKPKRPKGKLVKGAATSDTSSLGVFNSEYESKSHITPEAAQWEGHRYGLQAIKPAAEPILCFQKPYEGQPLDSIVKTGAGALNIDKGRIGTSENLGRDNKQNKNPGFSGKGTVGKGKSSFCDTPIDKQGRWPSNLIISHHPSCKKVGVKRVKGITGGKNPIRTKDNNWNDGYMAQGKDAGYSDFADPDGLETVADWECVEGCPIARMDEQSKNIHSAGYKRGKFGDAKATWGTYGKGKASARFGDSGGASRFFFQSHFAYEIAEQIAAADPVRYVAKASSKERNAGLDELPDQIRHRVNAGGLENEPRWSPIETKNIHPTVKPIALTKYLASLLLPPDSYAPRRIFCPFAGSGSEMLGALLAGWDEVTGIEMTKKYVPIANARLAWWAQWLRWGQNDVNIILEAHKNEHRQQMIMEL